MIGFVGSKILTHIFKADIESDIFNFIIFGLLTVSLFVRLFYFIFPVNYYLFLFLFGYSILIFNGNKDYFLEKLKFYYKQIIKYPYEFLIIFIISIFIAYMSAKSPRHYDVDLYHANLIRWVENFRIIPGLANLHSRYGFIGSFHHLSALTSFTKLINTPLHAVNGWMTWIFLVYLVNGIFKKIKVKVTYLEIIKIFLVLIIIFTNVITLNIASPITDLPITILTWLIFLFILEKDSKNNNLKIMNIIILPIFLISIKLSAFPLLLISVVKLLSKKTNYSLKKIGLIFFSQYSIIIILTNIVISGYLLYPFPFLFIKNLKWRLPQYLAVNEVGWIRSWAIQPNMDKDIILVLPYLDKLSLWFKNMNTPELSYFIFICILVLLFINKLFLYKIKKSSEQLLVFITSLIGSIFWFLMAPDFRLGYGYLVFLLISLIYMYFDENKHKINIDKKILLFINKIILLVIISKLFAMMMINKSFVYQLKQTLFLPMNYNSCFIKKETLNNLVFYLPADSDSSDDQACWNGFPGTPVLYDSFYPLGKTYEDGFSIYK